jgi:hypothetical protein
MLFSLGDLLVELRADLPVEQAYTVLLDQWPCQQVEATAGAKPDILFQISLVEELPPTREKAIFVDLAYSPVPAVGQLSVYGSRHTFSLVFQDCAAITLSPGTHSGDVPIAIQGVATPAMWLCGRLEDVLFTSLAPVLRRHGYYLMHAFAASREEEAILFVGPSGSGKTTVGLSLIQQGWQFLANDVVLLQQKGQVVYALPTPNGISLSPKTAELVAGLSSLIDGTSDLDAAKHYFPASRIISTWGQAGAVKTIIFPRVGRQVHCQISPITSAVSLAHLMESSLDRWDRKCLPAHLDLLTCLCRQASVSELSLGNDLSYLSSSLGATW